MIPGFVVYHSRVHNASRLTDAEFGHLIRALAAYSETGVVPELQGPEIYLFDFFRADVDTNAEKYRARCETNRRNRMCAVNRARAAKEAELPKSAPTPEAPKNAPPSPEAPAEMPPAELVHDSDDRMTCDYDGSYTDDPVDSISSDSDTSFLADDDRQPSFTNVNDGVQNKKENKKENKNQNKKQSPPYSPPWGTPPGDRDGFEAFYAAYPLHVSKQDALKVWNQLHPDSALLDRILSAVEQQKRCAQWNREGGRFIPYPSNWLRGRRWEDEPRKAQPQATFRVYPPADFSQRDYSEPEESLTDLLERIGRL